jgi:predicted RNA-binding Zn-ribbon protein involved in translation (DUF1610 family)
MKKSAVYRAFQRVLALTALKVSAAWSRIRPSEPRQWNVPEQQPKEVAMNVVSCPHCGHRRIATLKASRDVVVILPCPACQELVVLFRHKAIALSREVIENGSFDERKNHIAEIVAEFLEPGVLPNLTLGAGRPERGPGEDDAPDGADLADEEENPISDTEFQRFVRVDLERIDESTYFRRHFG